MEGDKTVAWFCTYTPLEILDAAGLAAVRRFGDPASLQAADALLHPAMCPYVRACLAEETRKAGAHHAVFVNSCDAMRRLYDAWKAAFPEAFVYLMDLPRNLGGLAEEILAEEYRLLMEAIREFWGAEIALERLRDANLAREEWRLSYLAQADGASGKERLRMAMQAHAGGATEAAQDNPSQPGGGRRGQGVPVLLTGNLLNPEGIVSILDKAGAEVVWIDLCNGDRGFSSSTLAEGSDLSGFLAALAASYLQRHPCARMSDSGRRYQLLTQRAREAGARGIIYASLKFCDSYLYDFPRVQEMLRREGIPLLRLESDYSDGHVGQVLTRVEAFLEMI